MFNFHTRHAARHFALACWAGCAGCVAFPQPKPEPVLAPVVPQLYQPNFGYTATPSTKKLGVTVGVIAPQFSANYKLYMQAHPDNEVIKAMLSGMNATFNELLIAKGFNAKGPFVSLNDMTFPDKKGSDLLLYPEFDFQVDLKIDSRRAGTITEDPNAGGTGSGAGTTSGGGSGLSGILHALATKPAKSRPGSTPQPVAQPAGPTECDVVMAVSGNILFVAQEPLSGERMWIKRLDVSKAKQTFNGQVGGVCAGRENEWTVEVKNAWAKTWEIIYQDCMKSFDNYVNGEEFQLLKHQSQELRNRKAY